LLLYPLTCKPTRLFKDNDSSSDDIKFGLKMDFIKYPSTPHVPWSGQLGRDDGYISESGLANLQSANRIHVSEKMDGETSNIYRHGVHARSVSSNGGLYMELIKALHSRIAAYLPNCIKLCGENLQWRHSIAYESMHREFALFSVWLETGECLSIEHTRKLAVLLDLKMPDTLYEGSWNESTLQSLSQSMDLNTKEGYVIRDCSAFHRDAFNTHVCKFVRKGHVQTSKHWKHDALIPNPVSDFSGLKLHPLASDLLQNPSMTAKEFVQWLDQIVID
jgi:hypothetical protein